MKKTKTLHNAQGFITMIVMMIVIVMTAIVLVFLRVKKAQGL